MTRLIVRGSGLRGPKGLDGVNAVENDTAVAGYVDNSTSQTRTRLDGLYLGYAGTPSGQTVKPVGDGRPGVWELVNDDTTGYIFHLVPGPNFGGTAAMMGIGTNEASTTGTCLIVSNKGDQTVGLALNNAATVGTGLALSGTHQGKGGWGRIESATGGEGTLLRLSDASGALGTVAANVQDWITSAGTVGEVKAATGNLRWRKDIKAWHQTAGTATRVWSLNGGASEDTHKVGLDGSVAGVQYRRWSGAAGTFYNARIHSPTARELAFDVSFGAAAEGAETYGRALTLKAASGDAPQVGFFGATPVAKPTGVAVTAAGIHAALVSLGLIGA